MSVLVDMVKNLAIYLIFMTVIKNLIGKSSYGKYVDFFMGLVLIIIIAGPLSRFLSLDKNLDYYLRQNDFLVNRQELEYEMNNAVEQQQEQVFADYEETLMTQLREIVEREGYYLYRGDIQIDQGDDYGKIKGIKLWVGTEEKKNKISIDKISLKETQLESKAFTPIVEEISRTLSVQEGVIEIYLESQ